MFPINQIEDFYVGTKKPSTDQSSNMARYGKMGILDIKPSTLTMTNIKYGDSINDFQSQLSRMTSKEEYRAKKRYLQKKKRVYTQMGHSRHDQDPSQQYTGRTSNVVSPIIISSKQNDSTKQLQSELQEIKRMIEQQRKVNSMQARFEKLYQQIQKKNSQQSINPYGQQQQFPMMYPPMYNQPPPNYYPPPYDHFSNTSHRTRHRKPSQSDNQSNYTMSQRKPSRQPSQKQRSTTNSKMNRKPSQKPSMKLNRNWATHLLKKYFFAVTFVFFLKKQSKKMALIRKTKLRKFWLQKFQSQVGNMKNWLLDCLKYSISIILQKKQLNFNFFNQKREKVRREKQKLVLQLIYLFLEQMKKLSNPKDVSLFSEILVIVCQNGSFPISRFWTITEMEKLRISEYYGFIRADSNTEKMLLTLFVFSKVLTFNMLLQPYKFDSTNFPKNSEPLLSNMYLLASILYHIMKQVLQEYQNQPKQHEMYQPGNWLNVKKEFICECCEPLVFSSEKYEQGEYISGMIEREVFDEMLECEENVDKWEQIRDTFKTVVEKLYTEMRAKGKMLKNNLKFKMYN